MTIPKLTVELVPKSLWGVNLRSVLPKEEWDRLRRISYRKARYKCEICGGVGPDHPVECHEIWEYDDEHRVQRLKGLISLCPRCHRVKHIGRAILLNEGEESLRHLAWVNGWSFDWAAKYVAALALVNNERSKHDWTFDISVLRRKPWSTG